MMISNNQLLRLRDVQARTGLSRTEIYRRLALGVFPSKVQLGRRIVAWRAADIDAYISQLPLAPSRRRGGPEGREGRS